MNKQSFTPGPWRLATEPEAVGCPEVIGLDERPVAMIRPSYRTRAEQLANGKLIAAAPAMLEALEQVSECGSISQAERIAMKILAQLKAGEESHAKG